MKIEHKCFKIFIIFCLTFILLGNIEIHSQIFKKDIHKLEIPRTLKNEEIICHTYFCFVFDDDYKQSKWVAYVLKTEMTESKYSRNDKFMEDTKVKNGTATNKDYEKSGYDRGHLVPAADMSFDEISLHESFYFSNVSPQIPQFNRGIWKQLEAEVRNYTKTLNKIYVVTGPILKDLNKSEYKVIGENNIVVPNYFYKAILYVSDTTIQAIGFVLPNQKAEKKSLYSYSCSIDELEILSGIDFFFKLPDKIEKKVEQTFDTLFWKNLIYKTF
jgi:endonuclease G